MKFLVHLFSFYFLSLASFLEAIGKVTELLIRSKKYY